MEDLPDKERRARVLAYFKATFGDDRAKIIKKTKYTKGKVAHYYDEMQPLGERAGMNLAKRLGLADTRYFEREGPSPPPKPNSRFEDPVKDTGQGVLDDLEQLHPDDKKAWIEGLRTQADKARELVRRKIAELSKKEVS